MTFETLITTLTIENLNSWQSDIIWQLIVTLDRIRNSCDVLHKHWLKRSVYFVETSSNKQMISWSIFTILQKKVLSWNRKKYTFILFVINVSFYIVCYKSFISCECTALNRTSMLHVPHCDHDQTKTFLHNNSWYLIYNIWRLIFKSLKSCSSFMLHSATATTQKPFWTLIYKVSP